MASDADFQNVHVSFLTALAAAVVEGSASPSPHSVLRAQPVALMLWLSKKRGEDLPDHGIVSSLASDPHLGDGFKLDFKQPWGPLSFC